MFILKNLAILKARIIEGLYRPFSREPMVCLETSKISARSSCLIPLCFRISSSLFFKKSPPRNGKFAFHFHNITAPAICKANFPLFQNINKLLRYRAKNSACDIQIVTGAI